MKVLHGVAFECERVSSIAARNVSKKRTFSRCWRSRLYSPPTKPVLVVEETSAYTEPLSTYAGRKKRSVIMDEIGRILWS